jgi:hypothetical protein
MIQRAAGQGQTSYDLVGRGVPSIDHFKESFNPQPVDYWSVVWAPWPVRLGEAAFALGRSALAAAAGLGRAS